LLFHSCCSISYSYDRYESLVAFAHEFLRESLPVFQSRIDVRAAGMNRFRLCGGSIVAPARRRVLRAAFNLNISPSAAANAAASRLAVVLSAQMRLFSLRLLPRLFLYRNALRHARYWQLIADALEGLHDVVDDVLK